ncbi:MAG: YqgE/AlgH family protein [Flavobacteriales bacterium]|nr:YqgE/AlgH family protein [Flavobacteriales bacterium]
MSSNPLDLDPDNQLAPARGRLLVSEPYLPDPYFRRTVVLLCEHNDEGSFGFVLNRFIDMDIGDLMQDMPPIKTRISIGGPVQSGNLYYLHTLGKHIEGSVEVMGDVHMGGDFEQLRAVLATDPRLARHVRFFVGYSGWGENQLQKELGQRSWLVHPADKRRVMNTALKDLWGDTLRGMGRAYAPLANFPEDPSLN